jgi:hypothetical protein
MPFVADGREFGSALNSHVIRSRKDEVCESIKDPFETPRALRDHVRIICRPRRSRLEFLSGTCVESRAPAKSSFCFACSICPSPTYSHMSVDSMVGYA